MCPPSHCDMKFAVRVVSQKLTLRNMLTKTGLKTSHIHKQKAKEGNFIFYLIIYTSLMTQAFKIIFSNNQVSQHFLYIYYHTQHNFGIN